MANIGLQQHELGLRQEQMALSLQALHVGIAVKNRQDVGLGQLIQGHPPAEPVQKQHQYGERLVQSGAEAGFDIREHGFHLPVG
ncbi:hypothetical protein D3C81_1528390 [compost metagenome]